MDVPVALALELFCILGLVGMAFRHGHGVSLYYLVLNGVLYLARSRNVPRLQKLHPYLMTLHASYVRGYLVLE
jgi:hypothetical protein